MLISDYSGATYSPCGYEVINHDLNNEEQITTVEEEVNIFTGLNKSKTQYVQSYLIFQFGFCRQLIIRNIYANSYISILD